MVLTAARLSQEIRKGNSGNTTGIAVIPPPDLNQLEKRGEASIPLRLGRWFLTMRQTDETVICPIPSDNVKAKKLSKYHFIPFAERFILHPNRFVLASTLEWIRLPTKYTAYVVGKSKLARRGLIVETAAGVHPGFYGCLTLEIANLGELPIALISGMTIAQLFVHKMDGPMKKAATQLLEPSLLAGLRKPSIGEIKPDDLLEKLKETTFPEPA